MTYISLQPTPNLQNPINIKINSFVTIIIQLYTKRWTHLIVTFIKISNRFEMTSLFVYFAYFRIKQLLTKIMTPFIVPLTKQTSYFLTLS
jgi:hypothetical protein